MPQNMSNPIPYERNVPYNHLPLLPPSDEKILTIEVLQSLNSANKALAELKGFARKLPNQGMLVNTIALREAKASTEIENIFTTDDELYRALSGSDESLKGNAKEVLFYREALLKGLSKLKDDKILNIDLITLLYRDIKKVSDGIRPTQTETVIKRRGSGPMGGTVVYTPPRGEGVIRAKLENLFEFMNNDEKYAYDPLLKMAIAHYQFEAIHPFRDGNGRVGRIINILFMIQKQLLDLPILYLSAFIINNKENYYDNLNKVTTTRNWNEWILYMLKGIEETSHYTIKKIEEIDHLFQKTLSNVNLHLPHIRKEVIEKIFEQPYINPQALLDQNNSAHKLGIKSLNTAKKYLSQLEQMKIMVPQKIGTKAVYLNIDLLNLLADT